LFSIQRKSRFYGTRPLRLIDFEGPFHYKDATEVAGMKKEHLMAAALILAALLLILRPPGQSAQSVEAQIEKLEQRVKALMGSRPAGVTEGSVTTIEYQIEEAKRFWKKEGNYAERCLAKAGKYLDLADKGQDPLSAERGIVARGYKSPFSRAPQPYSVYVPESYRSDKSYGLVLNLHGGSSTHNLFLAVTLGNWGLPWATYWQIRHDEFKAQIKPEDHLVAAPDGFGQIRWRWMAEMDVLSVVQDIRLHYNIDPKRVALSGLSNGGIGAYAIGTRYASRFSGVFSMAGISDWLLFHKASSMADWSKKIHQIESGINYAMNAKNTYYHFVHGEKDAGPMKVIQARAMDKRLNELGIDHVYHEIPDYGHDIIWVLWGKGRILDIVDKHPKSMRPDEVWLETLSYRAGRQHWLELAQMEAFLDP
jgi:predicted esterase